MGLLEGIREMDGPATREPDFPHAPIGWTRETAQVAARREGISMTDDHWELVRALQDYFDRHRDGTINVREVHDAIDEKLHTRGGIRFAYMLFPAGPVGQGCRIAGLMPPAGVVDRGFGSVA